MIHKRRFHTTGATNRETAARLNEQIKDFLQETGVFILAQTGTGNSGYPKYTLNHRYSDYQIVLQTDKSDYYPKILTEWIRHGDSAVSNDISFGTKENAVLTVHVIESGQSFCLKTFHSGGSIGPGGWVLRYQTMAGEQAFLHHSNGSLSLKGELGAGIDAARRLCTLSNHDFHDPVYALIQERPLIVCGMIPVGYALDVMTLNLVGVGNESKGFVAYLVEDIEYYGTQLTTDGKYYYASKTAVVMKPEAVGGAVI